MSAVLCKMGAVERSTRSAMQLTALSHETLYFTNFKLRILFICTIHSGTIGIINPLIETAPSWVDERSRSLILGRSFLKTKIDISLFLEIRSQPNPHSWNKNWLQVRPRWKLCILHPLTERKKKGSLCSFYAKFYLSWRKFGRYLNAPTKSKGVTTFYKYFLMVVLMLLLNRVPNLMFNLDRETWQRFNWPKEGVDFPRTFAPRSVQIRKTGNEHKWVTQDTHWQASGGHAPYLMFVVF